MSADPVISVSRKSQDRAIGLVTLAVSALLFYETYSFRVVEWDAMGLPFWPRLVLGCLGGLSLLFVARGSLDDGPHQLLDARAFAVLGGGVLYVALIPLIGYVIVTPVFIAAFSFWLGPRTGRSALQATLTAAIATAVIYYVFKESLYVQFPEGLLEERL